MQNNSLQTITLGNSARIHKFKKNHKLHFASHENTVQQLSFEWPQLGFHPQTLN